MWKTKGVGEREGEEEEVRGKKGWVRFGGDGGEVRECVSYLSKMVTFIIWS